MSREVPIARSCTTSPGDVTARAPRTRESLILGLKVVVMVGQVIPFVVPGTSAQTVELPETTPVYPLTVAVICVMPNPTTVT